MAAAIQQQPAAAQIIAANGAYGPNTGLAVQRSQYLADALRDLQSSPGDIRTPTALWSKLASDAILQFSKHSADKQAMQAFQSDRQAQASAALSGLPGVDTPPGASPTPPAANAPPAAPGGPPAGASTPVQPNMAAALQAAPAPPVEAASSQNSPPAAKALARGLRNNDPLNLTSLPGGQQWSGQTGTDGPYAVFATPQDGWAAADKNLMAYGLRHGINTVDGAVSRWSPDAPPAYKSAVAQALHVGPTDKIDLANPDTRHAMETAMAGFENGQPVAWGQGAPPAPGPQAAPPGPALAASGPMPPPQPFQVASNGPVPVPALAASGPGGGPSGGAAPVPSPSAGAAPIPHGMVSPEEVALARRWMSDPRTYQQGLELAQSLQMRQAQALKAPDKMMWGPDGRLQPMPGAETVQLPGQSPSDAAQRDAFGNVSHSAVPGVQGPVPEGMVADGKGGYARVPTQGLQTFRMPGVDGLFVMGPDGTPKKVAESSFSVKDAGAILQDLTKSEQYTKSTHATDMYRAAINGVQRPGGMTDAELIDFAAQQLSGGVARQFNQKMIENAQGPVARLKQFLPELVSGQRLSPQGRLALLNVMHDYATEAQGTFNTLAQSKADFAKAQGADLTPFTGGLMRELPPVPDISKIPSGLGDGGKADLSKPITAEQARALPKGTRFIGMDGVARVRQ